MLRSPALRAALASLTALSVSALGCAASDEEDIEATDDELAESSKVELRLAAFIPCEGISALGVFDGDGRSFSYEGAAESSRTLLDVTLDPDGPDPVAGRAFPSKKFSGAAVAAQSGWCVRLRPGAQPERTAVADASRVFARVDENRPDWQGYAVSRVHLEMHAKNPLVFLAPNLDGVFDIDVYYAREGGRKRPVWVTFVGRHDQFPSWELYVDGAPVFLYDALASGAGPLDLLPGNDVTHAGLCERRPSGWSCAEQP